VQEISRSGTGRVRQKNTAGLVFWGTWLTEISEFSTKLKESFFYRAEVKFRLDEIHAVCQHFHSEFVAT
jgi:hypothetical protein